MSGGSAGCGLERGILGGILGTGRGRVLLTQDELSTPFVDCVVNLELEDAHVAEILSLERVEVRAVHEAAGFDYANAQAEFVHGAVPLLDEVEEGAAHRFVSLEGESPEPLLIDGEQSACTSQFDLDPFSLPYGFSEFFPIVRHAVSQRTGRGFSRRGSIALCYHFCNIFCMGMRPRWSVESHVEMRGDDSLRDTLKAVGIEFEKLSPRLQDRFRLMVREQKTFEDDAQCAQIGDEIRDMRRREGLVETMSPQDWEHVKTASMLTDIGKTGPADASPAQLEVIAKIYGNDVNLPGGPAAWTMGRFLGEHFADEREVFGGHLAEIGISDEMSMRDFFNLHAEWSYDLIKDETEISDEAKVMAALHHILEGVNPDGLVDLSNDELRIPSRDRAIGEGELWVLLLDKYQAGLRRGQKTQQESIAWLRMFVDKWVALKPYPDALKERLQKCIDDIEMTFVHTETTQNFDRLAAK